jgi:hypothetical protein
VTSFKIQKKNAAEPATRAADQTGLNAPANAAVPQTPGNDQSLAQAIERSGSGVGLDSETREWLEPKFGHSFEHVRVHHDARADGLARQVSATAFTTGNDIFFRRNAYDPASNQGRRLLAHELSHTIQQSRGEVSGTPVAGGVSLSDPSDSFERAAETQADAVMQSSKATVQDQSESSSGHSFEGMQIFPSRMPTVQRNSSLARPVIQRYPPASGVVDATAPPPSAVTSTPTPTPAPGSATTTTATPAVNPEQARRLQYAMGTLSRVPRLTEDNRRALERAIPSSSLYSTIQQRDQEHTRLEEVTHQIMVLTPENGTLLPGSAEEIRISDLHREQTEKTELIERLNTLIQQDLRANNFTSEEQLIHVVRDEFPLLFLERGKQIAITELEQNKEIAEREAARYGLMCRVDGQNDIAGLRQAAQAIADKDQNIVSVRDRMGAIWSNYDAPSGGVPEAGTQDSSAYDRARHPDPNGEIHAAQDERDQLLRGYQVRFPILLRISNPTALAHASDEEIAGQTGGQAQEIITNIDKSIANVRDGDLKIWNLNQIVEMTKMDMGINGNAVLEGAIQEHIGSEQTSAEILQAAITALQITTAIVAIVATGGVAAAALGAGAALSVGVAINSTQEYLVQSAAHDSAIDPAQAISASEPSLFWLAVDIVGAVADVVGAGIAFRNLKTAIQVAREIRATAAAVRIEESMTALQRSARAEAASLEASGKLKPGMSADMFVDRLMNSVTRHLETAGEAAARRTGLIAELTSPTSRWRGPLLAGDRRVMQELLEQHGHWKQLMSALSEGGEDMQKIGNNILKYRQTVVDNLGIRFPGTRPAASASTELISDVDLATSGANAGERLLQAEAYMTTTYGEGWSDMFRMNFYTEAGRLTQYEGMMAGLSQTERAGILTRMTEVSDRFNYARMLEYSQEYPDRLREVMQLIGSRTDLAEIRALANMPANARVARRADLLREIDGLVGQYRNAPSAALAERITTQQIEANFHTLEAYIGPGAGRATVTRTVVVGHEALQAAMSNLAEMQHIIHESGGDVVRAAREYELFKYVNRFTEAARNAGRTSPQLTYFEHLSEYMYQVERDGHGALAHQYTNPKAMVNTRPGVRINDLVQEGGRRTPVTDDFLRQQYHDFMDMVNHELPEIRQAAGRNPGEWAASPPPRAPQPATPAPTYIAPPTPAPSAVLEQTLGVGGTAAQAANPNRRGEPTSTAPTSPAPTTSAPTRPDPGSQDPDSVVIIFH